MLKFGAQINPSIHVKLFGDSIINSERLPKSNLVVYFSKIRVDPVKRKNQHLFPNDRDYTFRKYGKLKDFTWYNEIILVTTKSHLEYIKNSPKLSIDYVDEEILAGRVYGVTVIHVEYNNKSSIKEVDLRLVRFNDINNLVYLNRYGMYESVSDVERFIDMIADADVIALKVDLDNPNFFGSDIVIYADDKTKIFLDKLMTIYNRNMRDYLYKHNITLGMVLDNLDLYHCLSYGV